MPRYCNERGKGAHDLCSFVCRRADPLRRSYIALAVSCPCPPALVGLMRSPPLPTLDFLDGWTGNATRKDRRLGGLLLLPSPARSVRQTPYETLQERLQ